MQGSCKSHRLFFTALPRCSSTYAYKYYLEMKETISKYINWQTSKEIQKE